MLQKRIIHRPLQRLFCFNFLINKTGALGTVGRMLSADPQKGQKTKNKAGKGNISREMNHNSAKGWGCMAG